MPGICTLNFFLFESHRTSVWYNKYSHSEFIALQSLEKIDFEEVEILWSLHVNNLTQKRKQIFLVHKAFKTRVYLRIVQYTVTTFDFFVNVHIHNPLCKNEQALVQTLPQFFHRNFENTIFSFTASDICSSLLVFSVLCKTTLGLQVLHFYGPNLRKKWDFLVRSVDSSSCRAHSEGNWSSVSKCSRNCRIW